MPVSSMSGILYTVVAYFFNSLISSSLTLYVSELNHTG